MTVTPLPLRLTGCIAMSLLLCACAQQARIGGNQPADDVIDELREDNAKLRTEVDRLQMEVQRRVAQLEAVQQTDARSPATAAGDDVPQLSALRFDRYTGALDTNEDGRDDTVRIYLKTYDQHHRFLPVAGKAVVQLVAIEADAQPIEITSRTWEGDTFTNTYRSGFTGTHYTLEIALPDDLNRDLTELTAKLTFTDRLTGIKLTRQSQMRVKLSE